PPGASVGCCGFFFFQAEDGIRDFHVTGVQTCALPILWAEAGWPYERALCLSMLDEDDALTEAIEIARNLGARPLVERIGRRMRRSEERRVGKEWRSRGWG